MSIPVFWQEDFIALHHPNQILLNISLSNKKNILIPLEIKNGFALSPGKGTFGGLYTDLDLENSDLITVCDKLMDLRQKLNFSKLVLTLPPEYFYQKLFKIQNEYFEKKAIKLWTDINHHININDYTLNEMSSGNRKKIKQVENLKPDFKINDFDLLEKSCEIIEMSRQNLGVKLSLDKDFLTNIVRNNSKYYTNFNVVYKGKIIAAAITLNITNDVLYVFYWADNLEFRNLSPTSTIFLNILNYAKENNFKYLDIGTSSYRGEINLGLQRYKNNLGAIQTLRKTFLVL